MPPPDPHLLTLRASDVARFHTYLSFTAFGGALLVASALHFTKVVKNDVAGWPDEWFPSVSATIGDWYPERNIFQLLIAITSGPRFALIAFGYLLNSRASPSSALPGFLAVVGVLRTLSCGGWVYVTSSDDHDVHDVLMILYILLNLPWMYGGVRLSGGKARRHRSRVGSAFWFSLLPMVYYFVQHKVHRIPGAYSRYAIFEWSLIFFDILYDSATILDFENSGLEVSINIPIARTSARSTEADGEMPKASANEPSDLASASIQQSVNEKSSGTSATEAHHGIASNRASALLTSCRPLLGFLADLYFAYQSWTLLTALPVTLFYFSVWKLALAGPEFSLFATLSPLLLGFSPVSAFAASRGGRVVLAGAAGVVGLGFWWAESMWTRLAAVIFGVSCTGLHWATEWQMGTENGYHAVVFLLGLILSSLSKHLNHGNNPAWPIVNSSSGGHHAPVLVFGFLALVEYGTRPDPLLAAAQTPTASSTASHPSTKSPKTDGKPAANSREGWLLPSVSLGALIYSLHERLSDPSSLIAWSWTGFPTAGPHPHLHTPLTLLAQVLGVLIALSVSPAGSVVSPLTASPRAALVRSDISTHPLTFVVGALSAYLLHTRGGWTGYAGGLLHAVFLTLITPPLLQRAGAAARARGAGRVFGTVWAVWIALLFTGTFTVAYAFVPGAWNFRERTDAVLGAQLALLAPAFRWRGPSSAGPVTRSLAPVAPPTRRLARAALALVAVAALLGPLARPAPPTPHPAPAHERARLLHAGIWTVHFGIDNAGRDSQHGIAALLRDMDLDVVGLLETDLHRPVFGNRDLTRVAVEDLGYYVDIGPGPNKHTWGCVLLSKFPILKSQHHLLPSPDGELAPAIEAILDVYGVNVTVIVAHNGQEETPLDRELQATELARIMAASYPDPLIFLGYVVTDPHAPRPAPYEIMVTDGRVHDIDKDDLDRWCEYIFYRGLYRTAYVRVSRGAITDTELQVGQFAVPRYGLTTGEVPEADRLLRAWKEDLPHEHWFPDEYYGDENGGGVRGHFYHVFNTPLYYKVPPVSAL